MSASARARASQKYKSRLSLERGGYGPHTSTPTSGAERARRFRDRRKADAVRNFSAAANLASTSNTGIPVLMDVTNEQTTFYLPFKNEAVEILDRNGFLRMYDERESEIMAKRKEFESNIDIAKILDELKKICEDFDNVDPLDTSNSRDDFVRNVLGPDGTENKDDFENAVNTIGISAVRKRSNVMSKQEYCHMMRSTNNGQCELILEMIHRLHLSDSIPIHIFFTGPAGSGKTYVLKLLMETYNRYTQQHNSLRNAFVACASTGKAAVNLGGVTVHSAFKITQSRRIGTMAREVLQNYRSTFIGVKCIIIDEVSMIGCDVLHKINLRLQEITGVHDQPFGNLNIIFCGDLHQLPPVNASSVYKGPRNSICGPVLWQSLDYYPLEQVMRQSDSPFSEILTKIGNGERLATEQIALIESRFRSRAMCKVNVPATVRLFHRNHDVDAYNNNAFIPEFENIADDKMIGYNTLTEVVTARRNLHKMSVVESGGLPYSLKLAVGYPYMITMNLDVEDELVNGAIALKTNR
ncbi:hypothetical protein TNCV_177041 [Trichonephila clavipes]|nr:hypothetical protein TNCV_177041 [Trichonephila clavipes]